MNLRNLSFQMYIYESVTHTEVCESCTPSVILSLTPSVTQSAVSVTLCVALSVVLTVALRIFWNDVSPLSESH